MNVHANIENQIKWSNFEHICYLSLVYRLWKLGRKKQTCLGRRRWLVISLQYSYQINWSLYTSIICPWCIDCESWEGNSRLAEGGGGTWLYHTVQLVINWSNILHICNLSLVYRLWKLGKKKYSCWKRCLVVSHNVYTQ